MQQDLFSQNELFPIHKRESNQESQNILNANRKRFSRQCQILFDALMRGERLTSFGCALQYKIMDARRRFCDLEQSGIKISERLIDNHFKERFFTEEDKIHNRKLLNNG